MTRDPDGITTTISDVWLSHDPEVWNQALRRYWNFVKPENRNLECALDSLDVNRLYGMDAPSWYDFLRDEYFRWKYTASNRYATTTRQLRRYVDDGALGELDEVRKGLLAIDPTDIRGGLDLVLRIRGLGTAGASGLLSLLFPGNFATVDQFVVKALREVSDLPEAAALLEMNPVGLTVQDGVQLICILKRKADENNRLFDTTVWTPRKIDMVLWTYGR